MRRIMRSEEIRKQFIDFFVGKGHVAVKSAPVIPYDDPTLLFTNAGMNQFKPIFLGQVEAKHLRMVDSQKCIRAGGKHNDLEEVGRDGFHHTFFEMLGNWSFGDYYKKEAIIWAWELLTEVWKLAPERLYATVHHTDKEAYELWQQNTSIKKEKIEYHGDKDNFWEMGETGPCGPCSEIHYDRGAKFCNLQDKEHKCRVNGDCERYIELWNLVFIQYNREVNGDLKPLMNKYVDTGAGFERLTQVLQGKSSNYETDIFMPIIEQIAEISDVPYSSSTDGISHRVISDHIRALSFAIADGGMPSNEGRGYVLRRILRRAARHGRLLGLREPFLYKLVDKVAEIMGNHYTELVEKKAHITLIIKAEEERFNITLDKGLEKFNQIAADCKTTIPGEDAFMLYDTYGFPLDLTMVMAEERGLQVDGKGFEKEMAKQKKRAREAAQFTMDLQHIDWIMLNSEKESEFVGYQKDQAKCKIIKYNIDDDNNIRFVLDKTPFYAESGGQIGDVGKVYNDKCTINVSDVRKHNEDIIHIGKVAEGQVNDGEFTAIIAEACRRKVERNHTATHLLHRALKQILGDHVQQKGSLVHPDYLRFDFTHYKQVNKRELEMIEHLLNEEIRKARPVSFSYKPIDKAKEDGAVALFGEKYADIVRVVEIEGFSKELCGGTHVKNTGAIGYFKILSESSIAAGIRRIEAITGEKAEEYISKLDKDMRQIEQTLQAKQDEAVERIKKLHAELKEAQTKLDAMAMNQASAYLDDIIKDKAKDISSVRVVSASISVKDKKAFRQIGDQLKTKLKSGVGVLGAVIEDKVSLLAVVTPDLTQRLHAGKIVNKVAAYVNGKGGGKPDMAMAGGKETEKLGHALDQVPAIIESFLE